jgi:hypothetical protein
MKVEPNTRVTRPADVAGRRAGRYINQAGGYRAFVPAALPEGGVAGTDE